MNRHPTSPAFHRTQKDIGKTWFGMKLNIQALSLLFLALGSCPSAAQTAPVDPTPIAPTTATKNPSSLLLAAHKDLEARNPDAAEVDARQALALRPNSAEAMYFLARLLQLRNVPRDSLSWFTQAAKIEPPSAEDLRIVALDYVLLNDASDALHWLTRSVAMDPTNAEAWYDMGRAQMTQGNYVAAKEPMLKALQFQPRMVKAENNLGLIYEAQNLLTEAGQAYREAVRWQTGNPHPSEQPLLNYGTLLTSQQHATESSTGVIRRKLATDSITDVQKRFRTPDPLLDGLAILLCITIGLAASISPTSLQIACRALSAGNETVKHYGDRSCAATSHLSSAQ